MGHCGLVELQGLLDGQVEGADQNGVKDGGHGDDGQHGGGELADHAEHGHLDDHEDGAGDKGGHEGRDDGDGRLDLTVLAGGEQDGEQDEGADIEFAAIGGMDGAGLGGGGVLRHGENPFGRGLQEKSGGA